MYATASDMVIHCDARTVCELVSDTNEAVESSSLGDNEVLTAMLLAAEGDINSAVLVGERYTVTQLAAMTGSGQARLVEMVCKLAFLKLKRRRGQWDDGDEKWEEWINSRLTELATGKAVFPIQDNIEAGNASLVAVTPLSVATANLLRDRVQNYYPTRHYQ